MSTAEHGGGSFMLWDGFAASGTLSVEFIQEL